MDPDSLDWIWGDFATPDQAEPTVKELLDDGADDDEDDGDCGFYFGDAGGQSDSSSDSDVGCELIGDERTARKLNKIVDNIKKR